MKKVAIPVIAVVILLMSAGCEHSKYKAGTYKAATMGKKGLVPVTVVFDKNKILSVQIGQNQETPGIGQVAVQELPPKVVAAQNTNIDGVSGASYTSKAILEGVKNCIAQAEKK